MKPEDCGSKKGCFVDDDDDDNNNNNNNNNKYPYERLNKMYLHYSSLHSFRSIFLSIHPSNCSSFKPCMYECMYVMYVRWYICMRASKALIQKCSAAYT
jgi:hypothetical protein